jgi:hypothetical protein
MISACTNEELVARSRQCVDDSRIWLTRFWTERRAPASHNSNAATLSDSREASLLLDGQYSAPIVAWHFFENPACGLFEVLHQLERKNLKVYGSGTFRTGSMILLAKADEIGAESVFERLGIESKH